MTPRTTVSAVAKLVEVGFSIHIMTEPEAGFVPIADLSEVAVALKSGSDHTRALIVYVEPSVAIAGLMSQGATTSDALNTWSETAKEHLKIIRKWRKKVRVIAVPQNDADRALAMDALQDVWTDTSNLSIPSLSDHNTSPFMITVAALAVHANSNACTLMSDLHSRSTGPAPELPAIEQCAEDLRIAWTEQHDPLTIQIEDLKTALDAQLDQTNTLRTEKDEVKRSLVETSQKLDMETKAHAAAKASWTSRHLSLEASKQDAEDTAAALLEQLDMLNTTQRENGSRATEMAQMMTNQIEELEEALEARTSLTNKLNADKANLEKALSDAEDTLSQKTQALDAAQTENNTLTASLEAMRKENTLSAAAIGKQTKAQLVAQNAKLGELQNQLESAHKKEASKLIARLNAVQSELETERQLSEILEQQINDLQGTLESTLAHNAARGAQIQSRPKAHDASLTRLTEVKDVYKRQARQLETTLQMVEADRSELRARLDDMYASTSWKVTKPIRSLKRGLRK